MTPDEYLKLSKNTTAPQSIEQRNISKQDLIDSLFSAYAGTSADSMKRKIFYKDANHEQRHMDQTKIINDIKDKINNDVVLDQSNMDLFHGLLGINSEAGELTEALVSYLSNTEDQLDVVNLREELGDILWYIALICRAIDCSFEELMQMNIDKLEKRFPEKFTCESAINRNVYEERKVLEHAEKN
jgi:NTP pyrophosphatase (non-canonical NTP hydrolase)